MKDVDREDQRIRERHGSDLRRMMNRDASRCPAPDILIDWREGRLPKRKRSAVEDHVCVCALCLDALEALRNQADTARDADRVPDRWPAVEMSLNARFSAALADSTAPHGPGGRLPDRPAVRNDRADRKFPSTRGGEPQSPRRILSGRPWVGVPALAGGIAALALVAVYSFALLNRDPSFKLARVRPEKPLVLRSGTVESPFQGGLRKFARGEYRHAAKDFETDLEMRPGRYSTLYYLGLCRLAVAERGLPGLPLRFDAAEARSGSEALEKALAAADDNAYYRADCLWYLGKAALMTGDMNSAEKRLGELKEMKLPDSSRPVDAERLLTALAFSTRRKD
jgi:hypothetical protein